MIDVYMFERAARKAARPDPEVFHGRRLPADVPARARIYGPFGLRVALAEAGEPNVAFYMRALRQARSMGARRLVLRFPDFAENVPNPCSDSAETQEEARKMDATGNPAGHCFPCSIDEQKETDDHAA